MGRPLCAPSRAVLVALEEGPKTIAELEAVTGVDRVRLVYHLQNLRRGSWVTVAALIRKGRGSTRVYGLMRRLPPAARRVAERRIGPPAGVAVLLSVFGINLPRKTARGRRVRAAR